LDLYTTAQVLVICQDHLDAIALGIHWEAIDEDISVEGLLAGKPSGESQASFKKWLSQRSSTGDSGG